MSLVCPLLSPTYVVCRKVMVFVISVSHSVCPWGVSMGPLSMMLLVNHRSHWTPLLHVGNPVALALTPGPCSNLFNLELNIQGQPRHVQTCST